MNAIRGPTTIRQTGSAFTGAGYEGAWVEQSFWRAALNTAIVTFFVTATSLTIGTLGGYALARSGFRYTFWILMLALVFRAMPPVTLVSGYLLPFFQLNIWGYLPTTIIVLVAINQPFTLWMLHSFFLSIPRDLDESALVDGCTRFQAFRLAVIPVMWPGVVTTGLFSFLLAYNDFTVTSMLLTAGQPDHGAADRRVPRLDPGGGQGDVRRRLGRLGHRAALRAGDDFPASDRLRPDRRRSERIAPWPSFD